MLMSMEMEMFQRIFMKYGAVFLLQLMRVKLWESGLQA